MADNNPTSDLQRKLAEMRREGEERAAEREAQKAGLPYVDLRKTPVSLDAVSVLREEDAKKAQAVPLQRKHHKLALAAFNPGLPELARVVEDLKTQKYEVNLFVASLSAIQKSWDLYRFVRNEKEAITGKVTIDKARIEELLKQLSSLEAVVKELGKIDFTQFEVVKVLEVVLAGALGTRASDIHLEAEEEKSKIRYRVDGALYDVFDAFPKKNYHSFITRIKLLSELKINVTDEPQDGRFTINLGFKEIELRVSIIPAEFGETVVMRVLDPESINIGLSGLGLRDDDLALAEKAITAPHGLVLNTGPTGSGKTTTLYAFLRHVNKSDIKIITVEDPIEYRLEGVEQTQVEPDAGYTFASGLRSILRQDPDVILVGEIRDQETADIALQAALTGHLVLSTLHTNDAVGAVPRLIDLGVKAQTIGPALSLVIAQRLVRVLCPKCKKPAETPPDLKANIAKFFAGLPKRVDQGKYANYAIYEPVGCAACSKIGYRGRRGIFEFFEIVPEFEAIILKDASGVALRELARKQEMVTMQQDGVLKVLQGMTTFDEVASTTGPIEWERSD